VFSWFFETKKLINASSTIPLMLRTHNCGELSLKDKGSSVRICGWVNSMRGHGGVTFVDVRDRYGVVQIVLNEKVELHREDVIQVFGIVNERKDKNPDLTTGEIEVVAEKVNVLGKSEVPPFEIVDDTNATEELRMKYRFLDLRRPKLQKNFMIRHKAMGAARNFLYSEDFLEIETPLFVKATPEGARDYIVPSRVNKGQFYALPQSPQLYKQLLMVAGFDRYFQLARCLRDEDLRADRQPEFTQIDVEMSFPELEDVYNLGDRLLKAIFKETSDFELELPTLRIPYKESMNKYGCDKPDLRFDLFLHDVSDICAKTDFGVFKTVIENGGIIKCINPEKDFGRKDLDKLEEFCKRFGAKGMAYVKIVDGKFESGIAKFLSPEIQAELISRVGGKSGVIIFIADKENVVNKVLSRLRNKLGKDLELYDPKDFKVCWIVDFPLFEWDEENKKWAPAHHMFTMPKNIDDLENDPGKVVAQCYDLVLNGVELASGSIRCHDPSVQERIMKVVGFPKEEAEERFGFLLNAFKYGAPVHAGFAIGFDRLVAMICGEEDIREVIAFPKNKDARSVMDGCPNDVDPKILEELGIKLR
jgi:aspartyl-tRNA synthetase